MNNIIKKLRYWWRFTSSEEKAKRITGISVLLGFVVWFLVIYFSLPPTPASYYAETTEDTSNDLSWIVVMEDKVRGRLKDPSSAKFSNSRVYRAIGAPLVCGDVNAKNSYGGYSGDKGFIAGGSLIYMEQDMAAGEFRKLWNEVCK